MKKEQQAAAPFISHLKMYSFSYIVQNRILLKLFDQEDVNFL